MGSDAQILWLRKHWDLACWTLVCTRIDSRAADKSWRENLGRWQAQAILALAEVRAKYEIGAIPRDHRAHPARGMTRELREGGRPVKVGPAKVTA